MRSQRALVVIADDFGIGPATSQGILDLALGGVVTGAVLLVNSPHAEDGVRAWRQAGCPLELGWHPTLTSDRPILPAERIPSLTRPDGSFFPLGRFLVRLFRGAIEPEEIHAELRAQYQRFHDLIGHPPTLVNSHQHIGLFRPVGPILLDTLASCRPLPYVRRVREPWRLLWRIPGARVKRSFLSWYGKSMARRQQTAGFPGNDWLAGIANPHSVKDPAFFVRWLQQVAELLASAATATVVELACHPGHYDATLIGRDCRADDGLLERRVNELALLRDPSFPEACRDAGFRLLSPSALGGFQASRVPHAA